MKYNLKLLYSPIKWLGCLILVILIPIAMYVPTYFDFVNVSTIYLPFVGIVLFTDINLLDKGSQSEEIAYLSDKKPITTFIQRYLIAVVLLFMYIIFSNIIFRILQQFRGEVIVEPISTIEYILIAGCGCLFVGAISMTISSILNNVYIGYGFSIIFWLYWNINCQMEMIINPFPFIANPTFYEKPLIIIYCLTLVLILINCFLSKKSPFYLPDKVRKLLFK
jgi:hypothetical protein